MTATLKPATATTAGPAARRRGRGTATRMEATGTPEERAARGKQERASVPVSDHAWVPGAADRPDAIRLLAEQNGTRVPELVPIRYGRMLVSPFTFYRGAARVMASDLASGPRTTLNVQLCGDAHLCNFGIFGSPERQLVFDINDFDETLPGPFEWDLKRLVASLVIAARSNGMGRKQQRAIATAAGARYCAAMADFAAMRDIDLWYIHLETTQIQQRVKALLDVKRRKKLDRTLDRARARDSLQAAAKLVESVDGRQRIISNPPLIVPLRELLPETEGYDLQERFRSLIGQYRRSLQGDRRVLLERYHFVDMARKVVGVGSVGTRCWIVLLTGRDDDDPLFLQIKEANESVLSEYLGRSEHANQGQRVVAGQRLMQEASDIFLGWQRTTGIDDVQRDFYFRQLRDWKGSVEVEALQPTGLQYYGEFCAWSLARAHARSGDRIAISAYLGSGRAITRALADFGEAYADLNERDHTALIDAAATGRVVAQRGL